MGSQSMADGLVIEEKKVSKHAARRARKRAKAAVVEPSEDPDTIGADSGTMGAGQGKNGKQQQIMGDAEPSLDDL